MTDLLPDSEGLDDDMVQAVLARWGEPQASETEPETPAETPLETPEAPEEPVTPAEPETPEPPGDDEPEIPPSPTVPETTPDVVTLPDGRQVPAALVQQWLDSQTSPAQVPPPVDSQGLVLPPVTPEDLEILGPAGQAMLLILNEQQKQQAALQARLDEIAETRQQQAQAEDETIARSAYSRFQTEYQIPDELMQEIGRNARMTDVTEALTRNGGDKYGAVNEALARSYWTLPAAQQFDAERNNARTAAAETRKRKLAGVGGPGGTAPRQTFDENTPQGRRAAMVAAVSDAMGIHE